MKRKLYDSSDVSDRIEELETISAEMLAMLKEILADSKMETDHYGVTTVDEEAVEQLIAKIGKTL